MEPEPKHGGADAPEHDPIGPTQEPWTSGQRPSPIPTHFDVNRPAPRDQGVSAWSIVIGILVVAVLGVLFKWSLAG